MSFDEGDSPPADQGESVESGAGVRLRRCVTTLRAALLASETQPTNALQRSNGLDDISCGYAAIIGTLSTIAGSAAQAQSRLTAPSSTNMTSALESLARDLSRSFTKTAEAWAGPRPPSIDKSVRELDTARARLVEAEGRDGLQAGSDRRLIEHPAAPVPWTSGSSVGVPLLDDHHRILMVLIARMRIVVHDPDDHVLIPDLLEDIRCFANWHFDMEASMVKTMNPAQADTLAHLQDVLRQDLVGYGHTLAHGGYDRLEDLLEVHLVYWMHDHLRHVAHACGKK